MAYDFKSLSDYDFELLCCDLLSARLSLRLESFRRGRDRGIDLRGFADERRTVLVQCKHYAASPFSSLRRAAREEAEKLKKLSPQRYLFATSQSLSVAQKDELAQLLAPWCATSGDIYGCEDLNTLLREHPQVEKAHNKLWLTSAAVLEKILHSALYSRSEFAKEEIREKLCLYVQSPAVYQRAGELLRRHNCCVLTGIPGIGKTTLAEILLVQYLAQDYEVYKITHISEALDAYRPGVRQTFFYDDFLGSTGLEPKLEKNEDKELLSFMHRVSRQRDKKFILTTRDYILNQAKERYEELYRHDFGLQQCVVSLADYNELDRGRILYNHLYFSGATREDVEDLLKEDRLWKIVSHRNYSPRLIAVITRRYLLSPAGAGLFQAFLEALDNPRDLWRHAFQNQIHPETRELLLLMATLPNTPYVSQLEAAYERDQIARYGRFEPSRLRHALREGQNTFLTLSERTAGFHNPSIRDFVERYIQEEDYEFAALCRGCRSFEQLQRLFELSLIGSHRLCRKYQQEFCQAARDSLEVYVWHDRASPPERIKWLLSINETLCFPQLSQMAEEFCDSLPQQVRKYGCAPRHYSGLLTLVSYLHPNLLKAEALSALRQFFLDWFEESVTYDADDFQTYVQLARLCGEQADETPVRKALEDYFSELCEHEIAQIEYEFEANELEDKLDEISDYFPLIDLEPTRESIQWRLFDLEEEAEKWEDEDEMFWMEEMRERGDKKRALWEMFEVFPGRQQKEG